MDFSNVNYRILFKDLTKKYNWSLQGIKRNVLDTILLFQSNSIKDKDFFPVIYITLNERDETCVFTFKYLHDFPVFYLDSLSKLEQCAKFVRTQIIPEVAGVLIKRFSDLKIKRFEYF